MQKFAVQGATKKESGMHKILIASVFGGLAAAAPALAQTTTTPATPNVTTSPAMGTPSGIPSTSTTTAPGSSEAPSTTAISPVEQDRLDPSAPSELRLQIDNGASAATVSSPGTTATHPCRRAYLSIPSSKARLRIVVRVQARRVRAALGASRSTQQHPLSMQRSRALIRQRIVSS